MNEKSTILSDEDFQKIRVRYLSGLELFDTKFPKQFLICPVGIIGAGKSTIIIPLAKKLGITRVSTDEIRKMLKEEGFNYDRARELMVSVAAELLSRGDSIAIDANCGSKDSLPRIQELAMAHSAKIFWFLMNPPESFIVSKLENYKHSWLFCSGKEAVKAYYFAKKKYGDLSKIGVHFTYTFDPSRNDLDTQIEEAVKIIRTKVTS